MSESLAADPPFANFNADEWELQFVYDPGTKTCSLAAQICPKGSKPTLSQSKILRLQDQDHEEAPQKVGYVRTDHSWRFVWGWDLEAEQKKEVAGGPEVVAFKWLKVCMYDDEHGQEIAEKIERRLIEHDIYFEGKGFMWLQVQQLREVRIAAMAAAKRAWQAWPHGAIDALNEVWFLAVPEVSNPDTCNAMSHAARLAGYPNANLISETEASGSWGVQKLIADHDSGIRKDFELQTGAEMIVGDAGGLTFDAVAYRTSGSLTDGVDIAMEHTGRNAGKRCGSEKITMAMQKHAREQLATKYGDDWPARLGRDSENCEDILAVAFEAYKCDFDGTMSPIQLGVPEIRNRKRSSPLKQVWVEISEDDMLRWYDDVYEQIKDTLHKLLTRKVKCIILAGGFFRNKYLVGRLRKDYGEMYGIRIVADTTNAYGKYDLSVVRGWLARVHIRRTDVPTRFGFGMLEERYWSRKDFPEITNQSPLYKINSTTGRGYVEDRWRWLIPPGTLSSTSETKKLVYQEYLVPSDNPHISKQIYWTELSEEELQDGAHARPNGVLLPGVYEWTGLAMAKVEDRLLRRYKPSELPEGTESTPRYMITAAMDLQVKGLDIAIQWKVAPPGYNGYKSGRGRWRPPPVPALITLDTPIAVHDANFSSFKQRSGNTLPRLTPAEQDVPSPAPSGPSRPESTSRTDVQQVALFENSVSDEQRSASMARLDGDSPHQSNDHPSSTQEVLSLSESSSATLTRACSKRRATSPAAEEDIWAPPVSPQPSRRQGSADSTSALLRTLASDNGVENFTSGADEPRRQPLTARRGRPHHTSQNSRLRDRQRRPNADARADR